MPGAAGEGSLYKRASDGKWVATVFLGYHEGTGRRVRRVFYAATQREVLRKRKNFLRDLEEGVATRARKRKDFTVGTWLDYWLAQRVARDAEPTTYDLYESLVRNHIKPHLGAVPLRDLGVEHVERWRDAIERAGVGQRTRQSVMARLRTALNFAVERRVQSGLQYNPAALVSMPMSSSRRVPAPNVGDARRLLDAARGDRLEAVVTVGLALGLRRGEVIGLRWEDVDLEGRTLKVGRRVSRARGATAQRTAVLVRQGTKMNPDAFHTVALPDLTVQMLRAHRTRQLQERLRAGARWKGPEPTVDGQPSGFVFTSEVGTVLEPRNVYRSFESMRHRAGLDEKTFHELRHDCASLLLAQGVPMYAVSQILRHSSPAITARFYAHLTPELQRQAADEMDRLLGPTASG